MAKECVVTKKTSKVAGGYSNRTRATQFNPTGKNRRLANLHKRRIYVPELKKTILVTVSTKGLRTISKQGAYAALRKAGAIK